jgi:hypothetical protein
MDLEPIGRGKVAQRYLQGRACDGMVLLSGFSSLSMKTPNERDGLMESEGSEPLYLSLRLL